MTEVTKELVAVLREHAVSAIPNIVAALESGLFVVGIAVDARRSNPPDVTVLPRREVHT